MAYSHIAFGYFAAGCLQCTLVRLPINVVWGAESILMKHLAMIVGGITLMYISHKLDYRYYRGISKLLMIITLPLLLYTLLFGKPCKRCQQMDCHPRYGFKLPNIRFGQACPDYLFGAYAIDETGKYQGCKAIIRTDNGCGLPGVYIDCAGQPFNSVNAFWRKCVVANYWPYQYKTNCYNLFCRRGIIGRRCVFRPKA